MAHSLVTQEMDLKVLFSVCYRLVTESEISHGILCEPYPEEQCLWISRNIRDLEDHLQNENAHYFIDINSDTKGIDTDAQELLQVLWSTFNLRSFITFPVMIR